MRADFRSIVEDFLSILEKEMRTQQGSRQQTLSDKFDAAARILAQISAALPIEEEICRTVSERNNELIDALTELSRWERDVLAFEPRP